MALTEEQVKNLKPGDPIIIHGTFWSSHETENILVTCPMALNSRIVQDHKYFHTNCCYLPENNPKYDLARKFKKGDVVRVVERDGRRPAIYKSVTVGHTYTVKVDEDDGKIVLEKPDNDYSEVIEWCYLELVTPVEDTLPYYMVENDIEFQVRMRSEGEDCLISTFRFKNIVEGYKRYYDMLPSMKQAREAAEAELNRLNEDYNNK